MQAVVIDKPYMILDSLAADVRRPFHVIASWHVFMTSRIQRFLSDETRRVAKLSRGKA